MNKTNDYLFKLLLVGDADVGKTKIMIRFSRDPLNATFVSTIAVDFKIRAIELDGKIIKLQIWDTAGQERFRTITTSYYRGANGIMLIYDITNARSFSNIRGYLQHVKGHAPPGVEMILIGNNCHVTDRRQVSKEEGEQFAAELGIKFLEVSAEENINVEDAFFSLARQIKDKVEGTNGSDECEHEDGSDEYGSKNACAIQ